MNLKFWRRTTPQPTDSQRSSVARTHAKKLSIHKKHIIFMLCILVLLPQIKPVQAGVFDPLLKVLLPFYKKDNTAPTEDDEIAQYADDGSDEYYSPVPDLPDIFLDDTLLAEDSAPMLDTPDLYALLSAEFAADRGNIEEALNIYKSEAFKDNATAIFERALGLSIEYETPKESLAFATAWQAKNPEHIPAWFYMTHLALKAHDYNQAVQMLAMILQYEPKADLSQIFASIFPTDPTHQYELFDALRHIDSNNPSIAVLRAGLLMRLNEYDASLLYINDALNAEPKNLAFINLKLDILKAADRMDELWQFLHQKRQAMPTETSLYLYEIRHLINQGDLMGAWQLLLKANANTQNPDVVLLAGLVGLDIGEHKKSIELLTPLTKNPDFTSQAHYYLGIGYERLGELVRARHHYERVKHDDNVLDARTKVVGFYLLENNVEAAMSTLVRLRDEYEIYAADSYILQAEIYLRQGNTDAAKDLLTIANRQYPDDDRLLFASYQLLENELTDEEKLTAIDKLIDLDAQNPHYQLSQAKLILKQNPDDKAALAVAKTISKIRADDPFYDTALQLDALILLGDNALKKGNYHAVIEHLQAAYEVSLDLNAGILLLRAYQGLGDDDMVQKLLSELQNKYSFNQNPDSDAERPSDNLQSY